jgi:hypothetical protein
VGNHNEADQLGAEKRKELDDLTAGIHGALATAPPRRQHRPIVGYRLIIEYWNDAPTQTQDFKCRRAANKVRRALDDDDTVSSAWIERIYGAATERAETATAT